MAAEGFERQRVPEAFTGRIHQKAIGGEEIRSQDGLSHSSKCEKYIWESFSAYAERAADSAVCGDAVAACA